MQGVDIALGLALLVRMTFFRMEATASDSFDVFLALGHFVWCPPTTSDNVSAYNGHGVP